jgi:pseudouridine-5'-phosphate glycosidase
MKAHTSLDLDIRPAVAAALAANKPVVAMASSPLSHTLPWPANLETVKAADEAVIREGAVLAVIAVWKGRLTVGLEPHEVELLTHEKNVFRAGRRDLATVVLGRMDAGTTVSATMYIAQRAGIRLLATGAIGTARAVVGDESRVWDISSDLVELSRTPVAVVSSGARIISELNYAAEVLDTFRVPVVGYRTDKFPTFYMTIGSEPVSCRVNTVAEAAKFLQIHWSIDGAGVVLAQPTPSDVAISPDVLLPALRSVEEQANKDSVERKYLSTFQMDKLNRLTWGKALRAYQGIVVANSRLAAQVARELQGMIV